MVTGVYTHFQLRLILRNLLSGFRILRNIIGIPPYTKLLDHFRKFRKIGAIMINLTIGKRNEGDECMGDCSQSGDINIYLAEFNFLFDRKHFVPDAMINVLISVITHELLHKAIFDTYKMPKNGDPSHPYKTGVRWDDKRWNKWLNDYYYKISPEGKAERDNVNDMIDAPRCKIMRDWCKF